MNTVPGAAQELLGRFGKEAALVAWGRADSAADDGDETQRQFWTAVMDHIERLGVPEEQAPAGLTGISSKA